MPTTTTAYDSFDFFFIKGTSLDVSCEMPAWQTIHMKYQVFSRKNNIKKNSECCLLEFCSALHRFNNKLWRTFWVFAVCILHKFRMVCWQWNQIGPHHAKMCLRAYADSESPDQPAHFQSDQDHHCPLTESLDTSECMNVEQRPGWF